MLKRVVLGFVDILSVSPDVLLILFMSWIFGTDVVVSFMVVDSFFGISHAVTSCLASSSFLDDKDNSPKGLAITFYAGLIVSVISLLLGNYLLMVLSLVVSSNSILHYIKTRILYDGKRFSVYGIVYGVTQTISYITAFMLSNCNTIILNVYIAYLFTRIICLFLTTFYYKYNITQMFKLSGISIKWLKLQLHEFALAIRNTNESIVMAVFKMVVTKYLSISLVTKSTSELVMVCGKIYSLFYNARELLNKERLFRIVESCGRDMDIKDSKGQTKAHVLFFILNLVCILTCSLVKNSNIWIVALVTIAHTMYYVSSLINPYFMEIVLRRNGMGFQVALVYVTGSVIQLIGVRSGSDYIYLSMLVVGVIAHYSIILVMYNLTAKVKRFKPVFYTPIEFYRGKYK